MKLLANTYVYLSVALFISACGEDNSQANVDLFHIDPVLVDSQHSSTYGCSFYTDQTLKCTDRELTNIVHYLVTENLNIVMTTIGQIKTWKAGEEPELFASGRIFSGWRVSEDGQSVCSTSSDGEFCTGEDQ